METTYTWEPAANASSPDESTRMTLRNRGEPAGFSKLMVPIMKPAMRRANRKDLAALKAILETRRRTPTPQSRVFEVMLLLYLPLIVAIGGGLIT